MKMLRLEVMANHSRGKEDQKGLQPRLEHAAFADYGPPPELSTETPSGTQIRDQVQAEAALRECRNRRGARLAPTASLESFTRPRRCSSWNEEVKVCAPVVRRMSEEPELQIRPREIESVDMLFIEELCQPPGLTLEGKRSHNPEVARILDEVG
jgi:hypothetical protein